MGLPDFASTKVSGSDALTKTQDATGSKDASPLGNSKIKLGIYIVSWAYYGVNKW